MKKIAVWFGLALLLLGSNLGTASAQGVGEVDPGFSNKILSTLGYQTLRIEAVEGGFTVPTEIDAGYTLVTLTSLKETFSYAAFMQPAEGLSPDEATELALASGRDDIVHEGWVYGGGSYAENGLEVSFVVDLQPGEWQVAASYQIGEDGEEIMNLYPLSVKDSAEATAAPETSMTIEMNDTEFLLPQEDISAGPQIYHVTNVGEAPRQLVLMKSPRPLTVEDFEQLFATGDEAPPPEFMTQIIWVGYAAIISPGQSVWLELDLDPGTYTTTSWVVDPETGMPALLLGMVDNFTVS